MRTLFVINDALYGSEKAYNALRLAMALQSQQSKVEVRVFLMADAVNCALVSQKTPSGYYNVERMLRSIIGRGAKVKL